MRRNLFGRVLSGAVACAAFAAGGETYKMSGSDARDTSSFNAIGRWVLNSNASVPATEPPCPGNDYITTAMMRTPNGADGNQIFGGDSLTLSGTGAYIGFKGKSGATITVDNLIADGGYIQNATDNTFFNLAGNITVKNGKNLRFQTVEPNARGICVKAPISGAGSDIWLQLPRTNLTNNADKWVRLEGDNSGFTGKFRATGGGHFIVNSDAAFGAVPATATADAITIHGPLWVITNNLETAATRGITLPDTQNTSTTSAEDNRYPGMRLQVSSYATAWIRGPISGAGPIVKTGDSGIVHFTGSFANYTGAITLGRGITWFDGPEPVSLSSVAVESGLGLASNEMTVAALELRKGNFWLNLTDADPDVPRLVVTDSLAFTHGEAMTVLNDVVPASVHGVTFQLVKAPGRALSEALAQGWLCPYDPRLSDLAVRDNGDGTETLLYTRTPAENIYYHAANDAINTSAFSTLAWKHDRNDAGEEAVAATAGNTYVVDWGGFRTPDRGSVYTFPGSKLVFNGVGITLKSADNSTQRSCMTNTWCMNKSGWWVSNPWNVRIEGDIFLVPLGDYALGLNSASQKRTLDLYSELRGSGRLEMYGYGNPAYGSKMYTLALLASNTNFHGVVYARGQTNFYCRIAREESLGANPPTFRKDILRFNGAGLMVTNNVTLDDSNRGIWLYDTGGVCGTSDDDAASGASYAAGTPEEDRKYPGGAWFNAYGEDTVLRVDCPVAGPGALSVYADGTVVLGGANAYAGGTFVRRGTLVPASADALPGAVTVMAGGTLAAPDDPAMPHGIVLKGAVAFEAGSALTHAGIAARAANSKLFTVPLMLLAPGQTLTDAELAALPIATGLPKSWLATAKQETVTVDGVERTAVSAEIKFGATTIIIR